MPGQRASFQSRDSHGMRTFGMINMYSFELIGVLTFKEVLIRRCLFLLLSEAKDQVL